MNTRSVTRFFGGKYMKYWYIAAVLIIIFMAGSYMNAKNIEGFDLTIYNNEGKIAGEVFVDINDPAKSLEVIIPNNYNNGRIAFGRDYIDSQLQNLPVSKSFMPVKKI